MAITVYSSLDSGAPAIPNDNSRRLIDNLRLVLKACLVTGYPGKPAAGWSVGHDVANGFSLGNGDGFINFVHSADSTAAIYLMEAITDPTTALAGGLNRRSSHWTDGNASTNRQSLYSFFWGQGAQSKSWVVVADEKTATVMFQYGVSSLDVGVGNQAAPLHFGRFYPVVGGVGFCALGGSLSQAGSSRLWSDTEWAGTVLRHPFTNLADQGAAPYYSVYGRSGLSASSSAALSRLMPRVLQAVRAGLACAGTEMSGSTSFSTGVYGGVLRGLLVDPFIGAARLSQVLPAIGVASPTVADRLRPLTLGGGRQVLPLYPRTDDTGGFVSLSAADWEPLWT